MRDEIADLSEKYSAALSEHETSGAVVQVRPDSQSVRVPISTCMQHPRAQMVPVQTCSFRDVKAACMLEGGELQQARRAALQGLQAA